MATRFFTAVALAALVGFPGSAAWSQTPKDIRWGTPPVGSAGHKAMVTLANVLNREMPKYRISVLPTPGAIVTIKSYCTREMEGIYGSDIGFRELVSDSGRFKGFKPNIQRMPVQSFWAHTMEVGYAVHVRDKDKIKKWRDLAGKRLFTGPPPFDTRAQAELGLSMLGIKFTYVNVDLATVGSQLQSGAIDGMAIYTAGEAAPPPWLTEASLAADWMVVNPSADEIAELAKKGSTVVAVNPKVFNRDVHADKVVERPFFYGFHLGLEIPADDIYQMLNIIEKHAAELASGDPGYQQIKADMAGLQKRGVQSSVDLVEIHPGLARWMREKGVWDPKWDSRVAKQ